MILADKPVEPDPKRQLSNALSFAISRGTVLTSVGRDYLIPNELTVTIRNRDKDKPLLSARAADSAPGFTLVFPAVWVEPGEEETFTGTTALTAVALVEDIEVVPASDAKHGWTVSGPDADSLVSAIRPKPDHRELIGKGGALMLHISDFNTSLPPFATQVYVLYEGIDGWDPGYETLTLYRQIPEPQIRSFMAEPPSLFCGEESRLSWSVLGCDRIELSYVEYGTTHTLTSDGEDASLSLPEGSLAAMPYEDLMVYTLSLYEDGKLVKEDSIDITVVMPVMDLTMTPKAAALGERAHLSWELGGRWAFKGTLTEGRIILQKISKPATDVPLRGSMPEEVRQRLLPPQRHLADAPADDLDAGGDADRGGVGDQHRVLPHVPHDRPALRRGVLRLVGAQCGKLPDRPLRDRHVSGR